MLKLVDLFFLLRPTLLLPVWTFLFLGYYWGSGERFFNLTMVLPKAFWTIFISYSLLMGGVYILNQIWDRESDRINQKLFLIPRGIITLREALLWFFLVLTLSFLLAVLQKGLYVHLWGLSFLMGVLYSMPPIKLKGRPIFDLLSNGIGYGFVNYLVGVITVAHISGYHLVHSIPYLLAVGAVFLNTTVPDIPGDMRTGERTTGVVLGARWTCFLALVFIAGTLASALILRDPFALLCSLTSIPFFALALVKPSDERVKLSYRIGGGSMVLLVALRFPPLLLLSFLTYLALKVYYRFRFNLNYPSLRGR
jgi:4-hydroxybenzoate polyprenyltransferase